MTEHETFVGLSYNVGQFSFRRFKKKAWVEPAWFLEERFRTLPHALRQSGADIIALQEVVRQDHARDLRLELANAIADVYPHVAMHGSAGHRRWWNQGNGLMILSKTRLRDIRFVPFWVASPEEVVFLIKGFLIAKTDIPGIGTVTVANAHMNAGMYPEAPYNEWIRRQQVRLFSEVMNDVSSGIELALLDLNAGPEASAVNYQEALDSGFSDAFTQGGGNGVSWHVNDFFNRGGIHKHCPSQRCDHVFTRGRLRAVASGLMFDTPLVKIPNHPDVPLSDHRAVWSRLQMQPFEMNIRAA